MNGSDRELPALKSMTQVLLAGKDWKARALLRAQLLEEGVDVEAHESVTDAVASLGASEFTPCLFIADLAESDNPTADLDELAKWSREVSVWIIASHSMIIENTLRGRGFELILFRPVD